jgi:hypothetical protein
MPKFTVQFKDGPAQTIEAVDAERAWDAYKVATGLRRGPLDPDPVVTAIVEPEPAPTPARSKRPPKQLQRQGEDFHGTQPGPAR